MNEYKSEATSLEPVQGSKPYENRSTGLTVFGILTILIGCLVGLFVPLLLSVQVAAAKGASSQVPQSVLLVGMLMYGGLAVLLVWLGVGSIMARRWARALLLIFSWSWVVIGVITFLIEAVTLPKMLARLSTAGAGHPPMYSSIIMVVMIVTGLIGVVLLILLSATLVLFYKSQHVKLTCEARDPVIRWTDRCPLPVLGYCLWSALGILIMLMSLISRHGVVPFFGIFVTGLSGAVLFFGIAAVQGYATWSLYKLKPVGWWLLAIIMMLFVISTFVTYSRHDISDFYRLSGYSETQLERLKSLELLSGNSMKWLCLLSGLPLLGYLLFIKKFLRCRS